MAKIALLGYGTIGQGVAEVLRVNAASIAKRAGQEIEIKYILDLREFPGDINEDKVVHDYSVIANDPEVSIVVEMMGGIEPAYTFCKQALLAGKSVATSNKALVIKHGAELIKIAKENSLNFLFEASVGGGIPIIRPLLSCLTADVVEEVTGILNGTTNYMMYQMTENGWEFDDILREAQAKGYAEADPTADIEGHDACRKIAILTSLVCGKQVDFEEIHCEGITKISATDIKYAKAMGKKIKLLASSWLNGDKYTAMVSPVMLPPEHPLYNVDDVFNAVFVHGNMLDDAMFYGRGAGSLPTASAVAADIVDIVKHFGSHIAIEWAEEKVTLGDYKEAEFKYFVRAKASAVEAEAAFGPIACIFIPGVTDEIAFVTESMSGAAYEEAAAKLDIINMIRMK
ncbi:MAG: homoserine dehydrogenase [Eubacterium sp.]|nr:homoserine dehydrogenase [Eubacterium sp.]